MENLKALIEKREAKVAEMEVVLDKVKTETRAFTTDETTNLEAIKAEIKSIDETIKLEKEMRALKMDKATETKTEERGVKVDLTKDLINGSVIKLEERAAVTEGVSTGGNVAVGTAVVGQTYADSIIQKAVYVSPLLASVNKIVTNSPLNIPLQDAKIGKFVKTAELADYVAQTATFATKQLGAVKLTNMFVVAKELVEDSMYNIESELIGQTVEAYASTIDELIVKGDATSGIEGLETLATGEVVASTVKKITEDDIVSIFYKLPIQYRQKATWVFSDNTAKQLAALKDTNGKPLLFDNYNTIGGIGAGTTLMGRPVVINNSVADIDAATVGKSVFFGDLSKLVTVGIRKNIEMTRSTEFGFLNDSIAVKTTSRLDIKLVNTDAGVYLKSKIA